MTSWPLIRRAVGSLALLTLAGLMIVAGGYDDSPGLQGLGLLLAIGTAIRWWQRRPGS